MIINSIDTLKHFVGLNTQDDITIMDAHLQEAQEEYIERYLGTELTDELDAYVQAGKTPDAPRLNTLLARVERPLAYFAYMIATPFLDVVLTQSGFAVVSNNNLAPASKDRVASLRDALTNLAHRSLERLLMFLERNKADYPTWVSSEAYFEHTGLLINTASDFDSIVSIAGSRLRYLELRPVIADIEALHIAPAITPELLSQLKEQAKTPPLSPENALILELVKRATANLTLARDARPDLKNIGDIYLSRAVNTILAAPTAYPSAASLFSSGRTKRTSMFQNSEDNAFFVS